MEDLRIVEEKLQWTTIDKLLDEAIEKRDAHLREMREHCFGDYVTVRVKVKFFPNGLCVPDENGPREEHAVFRRVTVGDSFEFDELAMAKMKIGERNGEPVFEKVLDFNEYRRLLIMKNLVAWSLDIELERDFDGWLTDKCWNRVANVSAPLLDAFVQGFEGSNVVTSEEEKIIDKQCMVLFGKNSQGVSDACEAVSKYCTYGNFSEKFNLSIEDIKNLHYREYLLLKMMISNENEKIRMTIQQPSKSKPTSRISMGRGSMPSRGTVKPLPGSVGT